MSRQLAKKEATQQQLAQQQQQERHVSARDVEVQEHKASANASAGLNLNLFGALSGAFSSKSKKTTHTNPDGSSESVEDRYDQGVGQGYAQGNGSAYAKGNAVEEGRKMKAKEIGQSTKQQQSQGMISQKQKVDHLGIEN